jgi:hypothetical protein
MLQGITSVKFAGFFWLKELTQSQTIREFM